MSVVNGQNADAATFNAAFASKSADNTLTGKQTLSRPGSGASIVDTQQAINDVIASDALKIPLTQKAAANGVATLDASTLIPVAQVPDLTASKITDFSSAADARITLQKGVASGIAPLDGSSKIDSTYLPSYVDDVVEVANYAALPVTGETGKIYVTLDTNNTYRWSGSVYVKIGQPIASTDDVSEGTTNLYYTAARVADKQIGIQFQDQGSNLGTTATVDTIDFIGAGITATRASNKVTVEVTATGSGGGSKNYFSQSAINPDFETGVVTPWTAATITFASGAPSGAPTLSASNMALSLTTTNPLAGTNSMLLTKSAANSQYQGFISGAFTIDREDTAKVFYGSFNYEVVSGTIDLSGSSTQSLEIWIYNTVSDKWTQPAGYRGMNQSSGVGKVVFSFQTDGTFANNSYKIAVFTQQTSASAYVVKFDDFLVGPQAIVLGTPVTDWQSYIPTFTGFGTATSIDFQYRRVGSDLEVRGKFVTGTATATEARITLPSGISSADTTKIASLQIAGAFTWSGIEAFQGTVLIEPNVSYFTMGKQGAGTGGIQKLNGNSLSTGSGQTFTMFLKTPVQGWSSNVQTSSDTDTRVVSFYTHTSSAATPNSITKLVNQTVTNDNTASYSISTGLFTAPISGSYEFKAGYLLGIGSANPVLQFWKNGSQYGNSIGGSGTSNYGAVSGSIVMPLNAGDTVGYYALSGGSGVTVQTPYAYFGGYRLTGPSVITATETVAASYWASANGTSSTTAPFNFDAKEYDSHNAVTTGASWKFTAPVSGVYSVSFYTNQNSPGNAVYYKLYKNSTTTSYKALGYCPATVGLVTASTSLRLNAGDYIGVYSHISQNYLGNASLNSDYVSHISINRIGN